MGRFARLLARFGQRVVLRRGETGDTEARAFLQPVLERREDWRQSLPTPLGEMRRDRFLYLGPPEEAMAGVRVLWRGTELEVLSTQAVFVGEVCSHQWAVLRPLGRTET